MSNIKTTRFGTPNGNLWLASDGANSVVAPDKELAKTMLLKPNSELEAIRDSVVSKYETALKNPMLVVGANNWVREHLPFYMLQNYDVHVVFYPNSYNAWVCGAYAISRKDAGKYAVYHSCSQDIETAMKAALWGIMAKTIHETLGVDIHLLGSEKIAGWLTNWIYRSPKIALKDVLALDRYTDELQTPKDSCKPTNRLFRVIQGGNQSEAA